MVGPGGCARLPPPNVALEKPHAHAEDVEGTRQGVVQRTNGEHRPLRVVPHPAAQVPDGPK
eukprot:1866417-Lingulodinium_polyedra.AAC.1